MGNSRRVALAPCVCTVAPPANLNYKSNLRCSRLAPQAPTSNPHAPVCFPAVFAAAATSPVPLSSIPWPRFVVLAPADTFAPAAGVGACNCTLCGLSALWMLRPSCIPASCLAIFSAASLAAYSLQASSFPSVIFLTTSAWASHASLMAVACSSRELIDRRS